MTRHSLFSFATSELSQDAFLCWLAGLADHDRADLRRLGGSFIAWLWERARGSKVEPEQVRLRERPKSQWKKIDITLEVAINEREYRFIIEDKTDTTQHGDQLKRYLEIAREDGRDVVPIYFKTGYYFGSDRAATEAHYAVVELRPWVEFLRAQTARSDILDDYRAYVANVLEKREQALTRLSEASGFEVLTHDYIQYEFLESWGTGVPRQSAVVRFIAAPTWAAAPGPTTVLCAPPGCRKALMKSSSTESIDARTTTVKQATTSPRGSTHR